MQNLGLAGALMHAAEKLGVEDDNSFLLRHLAYFNCNPNFVPVIVGGVLRLEEERLAGKPVDDNDIEYFKRALANPLALE